MKQRLNLMCRVALLLLALLPVALSLQAQDTFWVNGIRYSIDYEDEYYWGTPDIITLRVISATGSTTYSGEIVIPETVKVNVSRYEGSYYGGNYDMFCQVTAIGEGAFRNCTGLTAVQLPKSIKTIGKNAFYGCSGLNELTIPNGVSSIGEQAFAYCTGLTSMTLPNSVTSLGWNAFYSCTGLSNVTLSKSLTSLNGTFVGCTGLTTVSIPAGVQSLNTTFNGCTALTTVQLPRSLKSIEEAAFDGCTSLASIYLPEGVDYIGKRAFRNTALTSVELPSRVSNVFDNAFEGCSQLTSVTSRNLTPPVMANSAIFDGETYGTAALYVPAVAVTQYSGADWWKLFENIEGQAALDTHYDFEAGGIYYLITGSNTVEVTYKDTNYNSYSGNVTIPASVSYNGVTYSVTAIGTYAFNKCTGLTSIAMPATITSLGSFAFNGCNGLTSLNLPESLAAIGERAFMDCLGVTSLTIPENVTSIGEYAFSGIRNLTSLTWNARECWTNGNMITSGIATLTIGDEVVVIPGNLAYVSVITTLDIPQSVKFIGQDAFNGCNGLTSLTIPQNVIDIGTNAFANINNLTSLVWNARECWTNGNMPTYRINTLTIGDGVKILPSYLARNSKITTLSIPESATVIGAYAFEQCSGLTSVVIPDNVTFIGKSAFYSCYNVADLTLGKSVTTIDAYAFMGCLMSTLTWNARNLSLDDSGEYNNQYDYYHTIEKPTVFDFSTVSQLTIGNEVEQLPNYFAYQSNVRTVEIPNSVTAIGDYAFAECDLLTDVTLPAGLITIGESAFESCENLAHADLPASLTTLGARAFYGCDDLTSLVVPASLTSFGKRAFNQCLGLETIVVDSENPVYDSRENCNIMFKTANDSIMLMGKNAVLPSSLTAIPDSAFYGHTEITHMEIPASVKRIGKDAFNGCSNLTFVTLPYGLTQMGDRVFYGCRKLTSVTLPPALTQIGECAFMLCTQLNSVTIPASLTQIGNRAFSNCSALQSITVENGNPVYDSRGNCNAIIETASNTLTEGCLSTVIPSSVKTIGQYAFQGRSPSNVTIPAGVETIASYAFYQCDVENVSFGETLKSVGYYAFGGCDNLMTLSLGNSVETIGDYAFSGCEKLMNIDFGHSLVSIGNYAFRNSISTVYSDNPSIFVDVNGEMFMLVQYEGYDDYYYTPIYNNYDGWYWYHNWYGEEIWISEEELNELMNVSGTVTITLPESLKTIGRYAFYECEGLRSVVMAPNSVTSIGESAFSQCRGIESIVIPESLKTVDYGAFTGCNIDTVCISDLGAWCDINFWNSNSNPVNGSEGLYLNGEKIVDLVIPVGVSAVKKEAFAGYKGLNSATIANSVKSIGYNAFNGCQNLKRVDIGDSVDSIASYSFPYCTSLDTVSLGRSMRFIGYMSFYNAPIESLTSLATTPPVVESYNPFTCYTTATLRVPMASVEAYRAADIWKKFTYVEGIPGGGPGDMNGDGEFSVSDITMLINLIMGAGEEGIDDNVMADVNGDGTVNISDIVMLIEMVLKSTR